MTLGGRLSHATAVSGAPRSIIIDLFIIFASRQINLKNIFLIFEKYIFEETAVYAGIIHRLHLFLPAIPDFLLFCIKSIIFNTKKSLSLRS
jgi:hypothetical protein